MQRKDTLRELFYNKPTKHWHFKNLLIHSDLNRANLNLWLKRLINEGLIQRVKPRKKMPYYVSKFEQAEYQNSKKLFALNQLHSLGLLNHLSSQEAEVIILFGSFASWDWHYQSDIDIFIYGDIDNLYLGKYQSKLNREIQVFHAKNIKELKKFDPTLLQNIIKGITIKGSIPKELIKYAIV